MGKFLFNLILIGGGLAVIKYREAIGNMIGDHLWMRYVGGVYGFTVMVGILMFFFGLARITGTTDILMGPLISLIPGAGQGAAVPGF